jgi:hypothetical protein
MRWMEGGCISSSVHHTRCEPCNIEDCVVEYTTTKLWVTGGSKKDGSFLMNEYSSSYVRLARPQFVSQSLRSIRPRTLGVYGKSGYQGV